MGHLSQHRVKGLLPANLKERRFDESTVHKQFPNLIYSTNVVDIVIFRVELPIQTAQPCAFGFSLKGLHAQKGRPNAAKSAKFSAESEQNGTEKRFRIGR